METLRYGSSGDNVQRASKLLSDAGEAIDSLNSTFGWHMYVRTLQFQVRMVKKYPDKWAIGDVDGIIGSKTWAFLVQESGDSEQPSQPLPPAQPAIPTVDETKNSPNKSERGAGISHIILHNTAGSYSSAVSWLTNKNSAVSAHLVISRAGKTAQLVPFVAKAWHAGNARYNANSIGIEIEATTSQRGMTQYQEQKVIAWCRYLMNKYEIPAANVLVHRMVSNTDCPVFIWATNDDFYAWRKKNLGA